MSEENFYGDGSLEELKESIELYAERRNLSYERSGDTFKILDNPSEDSYFVLQLSGDDVSMAKRTESEDKFAAHIDPVTVDNSEEIFRYLEEGV